MKTPTTSHTPVAAYQYRDPLETLRLMSMDDRFGVAFPLEMQDAILAARTQRAELLAALEITEARLDALLRSREMDSTTRPFHAARTIRDEARAAIAKAQGGES